MNPETHETEVQKLFKDAKPKKVVQPSSIEVKYHIKRELSRLEIGHCFSLGLCGIKRSGEGISITFDLSKAHLNFQ